MTGAPDGSRRPDLLYMCPTRYATCLGASVNRVLSGKRDAQQGREDDPRRAAGATNPLFLTAGSRGGTDEPLLQPVGVAGQERVDDLGSLLRLLDGGAQLLQPLLHVG